MTTDKRILRQLTTLATFNKAASRLFIGILVAISKSYAAECSASPRWHKPCPLQQEETVPWPT